MRTHRNDLSEKLVHLIKDSNPTKAAKVLASIAHDQFIINTTKGVIGGEPVVCFSEAPYHEFIKEQAHFNGFGVIVDKRWLFSQGGRPVIYQPRDEHKYVAPSMQWKCITYDLDPEDWVDWAWQREWRIQTGELWLPPDVTIFITPSQQDRENVIRFYEKYEKQDQERGGRHMEQRFSMNVQCPYEILASIP